MSGNGTSHFKWQRITALLNLPLVLFFLWFVVRHLGASRADVVSSMQNPVVSILMLATLANVFWHMRLGMQVVIEDYVHGAGNNKLALLGNAIFSGGLFLVSAYAILKMGFGF